MNDHSSRNTGRVLGRTLAVEETLAVSGARPTAPVTDNGSFPPTDTGQFSVLRRDGAIEPPDPVGDLTPCRPS